VPSKLVRHGRTETGVNRTKQTLALGTAVLVALGIGSGYYAFVHRPATQARASIKDPVAAAAALDRSFRAIEDADSQSPKDRWDPDYVVGMLGRDPQRLFAWVRDNTDWIAYRGELRGAVGVLMDRQGSSLDRAVLLATLLERAGQHVRLAHGELTQAQAVDLLPALASSATANAGAAPAAIATDVSARVKAAAAQQGLDGAAIGATVGTGVQALLRRSSDLQSHAMEETRRLLSAMPGPSADVARANNLDAARDALRDYWWVQRQNSGQSWADLDPTRLKSGHDLPAITPTETLDLQSLAAAPLHHEIALRVIAEQWSAQRLTEHTVLDRLLRPSELIGQPVVLQFLPTQWLGDSALEDKPTMARPARDWRAEMLDQHEWGVGLQVGREIVASAALADSGDPADASTQPVRGGPVGGLASAFSATMNGGESASPPKTPHSTLSAVWLEYEIRVPGAQPQTFRRTVFDLLGPAARAAQVRSPPALDDAQKITRALALSMQSEILPLACRLAPEFLVHLMSKAVLGNRDLFKRDLFNRAAGGNTAAAKEGTDHGSAESVPPVSALYALALARMQWSPNAAQIYLARPNLLTSHHYLSERRNGIVIRHATDIVANEVAVDWSAANPFAARVAQGILDTNAEILASVGEDSFGNTGEAYARNAAWVAIAPGADAAALHGVSLSADVRRLIGADLASGYAILAPPSAVPMAIESFSGWWRIDPATGDTLGFGANGWGVEFEENGSLNNQASLISKVFRKGFATRFLVTFGSAYGWCLVPLIAGKIEGGIQLGPALKASLVSSVDQCVGDAAFIGIVGAVTMPLLALTLDEAAFARSAAPPPEPPPLASNASSKATTYNGVAPTETCNPAASEGTVPVANEVAPETTSTEEASTAPGNAPTPTRWPANVSVYEPGGQPGEQMPYKPAYVESEIQYYRAQQTAAAQAYDLAVGNTEAAQAAYNQAKANWQQTQGQGNAGTFEQIQASSQAETTANAQLAQAQRAQQQSAVSLQRANNTADYYQRLQPANDRFIQARADLLASNDAYNADVCRNGGALDYANPKAQADAQARDAAYKAYVDARSDLNSVMTGSSSTPAGVAPNAAPQVQVNAGGNPLDATQVGQPATALPQQVQINAGGNSLDATQRGQSGNTQQMQPVPAGTTAPPPDPYTPSAMSKSIAGVVSVGNILGGK
jgi:hypothetical protein